MADRPYVVHQGDYLRKIAARYAFDADTVWNDPKNAPTRELRKDPDQLVAGDVLYIPEKKPTWHPINPGRVNRFVAPRPRVKVSVRFVNEGKPLASEPYVIEGAEAPAGVTDSDGYVHCEVPMDTGSFRIRFVNRREIHTVNVGHLDPADEPSGAAQRLASLGVHGRPSGMSGTSLSADELAQSLRSFQKANKLEPTGELDEATSRKLVELHGS